MEMAKLYTLDALKGMNQASKAGSRATLPKYLQELWREVWGLDDHVGALEFLQGITQWFEDTGALRQLDVYDADLRKKGCLDIGAIEGLVCGDPIAAQLPHSPVFLRHVLLPSVDEDGNGLVTTAEMVQLQIRSEEYANLQCFDPPSTPIALLDSIYRGQDKADLTKRLAAMPAATITSTETSSGACVTAKVQLVEGSHLSDASLHAVKSEPEAQQPTVGDISSLTVLQRVLLGLKVEDVVRSYRVAELLPSYVPGTRMWLYDKVESWLNSVAPARTVGGSKTQELNTTPEAVSHRARLLLLLAGPGMGKSVFSAVVRNKLVARCSVGRTIISAHHFFKVST